MLSLGTTKPSGYTKISPPGAGLDKSVQKLNSKYVATYFSQHIKK